MIYILSVARFKPQTKVLCNKPIFKLMKCFITQLHFNPYSDLQETLLTLLYLHVFSSPDYK